MQDQQQRVVPSWVHFTLHSRDGSSIYASARLPISGQSGWHRVEAALTADASDTHAKLGFSFEGPGMLLLDVVSLFLAENYAQKGPALNPWPFRADPLGMLQALRPKCAPACAASLTCMCLHVCDVQIGTCALHHAEPSPAQCACRFLRFPGGCYVEGGDWLKDRFKWKQAVGPIESRPGHWNGACHYWSTDGAKLHTSHSF